MNKQRTLALLSGAFFCIALLFNRVLVSAQPGDASDPIVTKSYVDGEIDKIRALFSGASYMGTDGGGYADRPETDAVIAEVIEYVENVFGALLRQSGENTAVRTGASAPFEALFLVMGKTVVAESGSEIILRGGKAIAVSGVNGLCDVTSGADIVNGSEIPLNHLLIVPASDGRGITATYDAYVMIKGAYVILE